MEVPQLETRIAETRAYRALLVKASAAIKSMSAFDTEKKQRLISSIESKLLATKVPAILKRSAKHIQNELWGIQDGIIAGVKKLEPTQIDAVIQYTKEVEARDLRSVQCLANDVDEYQLSQDEELQRVLQRTDSELGRIKDALNKRWVVRRAPIIPIVDNSYLDFAKLKKFFDISNLQGYVVLHNQLVLGVNTRMLSKEGVVDSKADIQDYVAELVKLLSKKKRIRYVNICTKGQTSELTGAGVSWYWLMPEREADNLRRCFIHYNGTSQLSKKTYGFQFLAISGWGFANSRGVQNAS